MFALMKLKKDYNHEFNFYAVDQNKEYMNIVEEKPGNPTRAIEFLCKDERFMLRMFNSILRTQNLKFFRYVSPFLKLYQDFFEIEA